MEVYVRRGEEQFGPLTRSQIEENLASGVLIEGDIAWHKGLEDWVPVHKVLGTIAAAETPSNSPSATEPEKGGGKKILLALAATVVIGGVAGVLILPGLMSGEDPKLSPIPPAKSPAPSAAQTVANTEPAIPPTPPEPGAGTGFEVEVNGPDNVVENTEPAGPDTSTSLPALPVNVLPEPNPAAPAAKQSTFAAVTRHLDRGGSFYTFLSTKQAQAWMQAVFAEGETVAAELGFAPGQSPVDIKAGLDLARDVHATLGLAGIDGIGASTRELPGGLKRNVAVIHRETAKGEGLIWKAFGTAPHALSALNLMPAHTALAVHGDLDLAAMLAAFQSMVAKHGTKQLRGDLENDLKNAALKTLLKSYGGELGFFVTLDAAKTIEVPAGSGLLGWLGHQTGAVALAEKTNKDGTLPALPVADKRIAVATVKIPEPGLVLVVRVRDDVLQELIEGLLGSQGLPPQMAQVGGVPIRSLPQPMPLECPFPVQPAMARVGDYLIIASNPALAENVVSVHQGKSASLTGSAEFKKLAGDLLLKGNQFSYLSETLARLHVALSQPPPGAPAADPVTRLLSKLTASGMAAQWSVVTMAPREIVLRTHTRGPGYDSAVLLAGAGVPVMMGLALAAPGLLDEEASLAGDKEFNAEMKLSQGRLLGVGMMRVSQTNGQWPPAETWSDELLKIVQDPKHFVEPVMVNPDKPNEKICTWLFNRHLAGLKPADLPDPRNTVLLFAAESLEWNGAGDEQDFPVDVGEVVTVFADGHLEVVESKDLARLKWKP